MGATAHPSLLLVANHVFLPLLSSSCCAVQLAVNAVAVLLGAGAGCVGFNKVLGPIRPYLLAAMIVYSNVLSGSPLRASGILSLSSRYAITFLPELVYWWNEILRSKWKSRWKRPSEVNIDGEATRSHDSLLLRATLIVDV